MKRVFEYSGMDVMMDFTREQACRHATDLEDSEASIQALGVSLQLQRVVKEMTLFYINQVAHGEEPVAEVDKRVMAWTRFLNEFFPEVAEDIYEMGQKANRDTAIWNWTRLWEAYKYRKWRVKDEWEG